MSTKKERFAEFAQVMQEEAGAPVEASTCARLSAISYTLHASNTLACNRSLSERQQASANKLLIEAAELLLNCPGVLRVENPGDPRAGVGLRIYFKSGRHNSFGGEGWNVPTL